MFKEKILAHEIATGHYDALKPPIVQDDEAQGERFAPLEFAALVHEESSMLSGRLQDELIHRELNLVIDTVLKSEASAEVIATRLDRAEYTYDVVSVQITEDISKASIRERWEQPYRTFLQADQTEGTCLGGRPVPSNFTGSVFANDGGPSTTEGAAQWLAQHGEGATTFRQYRRDDGQSHVLQVDELKCDGKWVARTNSE